MADKEDFSRTSDETLVEAYVENVQIRERIEHIGAANRLMDKLHAIVEELRRRSGGTLDQLRPLLRHSDLKVRHTAAIEFRRIDHATFEATTKALAERSDKIGMDARHSLEWDAEFQKKGYPEDRPSDWTPPLPCAEMTWQSDTPPPPGITEDGVQQLLSAHFSSETRDTLSRFARPAIGLWPQRPRADSPMTVSRLGGAPSVPDDWLWPMVETEPADEPMLFLGQINCAELQGIAGADRLPASGMLSFFGDHDGVMGCDFGGGDTAVFYWEDVEHLKLRTSPKTPMEPILPCGLAFRAGTDLPHPESATVRDIWKDRAEAETYDRVYRDVREFGIPEEYRYYCSHGKLLGWPTLVQQELQEVAYCTDPRGLQLLLQLDDYHNGTGPTGWGPGGSLYFLVTDAELRARKFEECLFEIQVT
ncbi:MAG: DUF1963 domain-containing protein [Pseudomonadota bacterium]